MPVNNKKNQEKYLKEIDIFIFRFQRKLKAVSEEIKDNESSTDIEQEVDVLEIKKEIKNIDTYMYMLNDKNTSYEKMGLDHRLHKLKFITKILENINLRS